MAVKAIPDGYHTVTPYLVVDDAEKLLKFVKDAFGAVEHDVTRHPDGTIWHADVTIGDSHVMMSQATDQHKAKTASIYLYVPDTDDTYRRALAAGAISTMEPATQFYGDRGAGVEDRSGITWWIGTHVEDVSPEEMKRRIAAEAERRRTA
jgi:uncharacterized glyoxalase superfamily protein PhnB